MVESLRCWARRARVDSIQFLRADRAVMRGNSNVPGGDRPSLRPAQPMTQCAHRTVRAMSNLQGKTAVVTGANTGIGRVTAAKLANQGATVILACRSEDKTRPVLEEIRAAGGVAEFTALD